MNHLNQTDLILTIATAAPNSPLSRQRVRAVVVVPDAAESVLALVALAVAVLLVTWQAIIVSLVGTVTDWRVMVMAVVVGVVVREMLIKNVEVICRNKK